MELTADPVVNALRRDTYPGSVLIKFGLFRNRTGAPLDIAWSPPALHITRPCQLRVHLYQARHLPIGNRDGSSDPYVVVRCNGFSQKTAVQRNVLHPVWYTTQYFDLDLPDISVAPEVVLQVWDWKRVGDTLLGERFKEVCVCVCRESLNTCAGLRVFVQVTSGSLCSLCLCIHLLRRVE